MQLRLILYSHFRLFCLST